MDFVFVSGQALWELLLYREVCQSAMAIILLVNNMLFLAFFLVKLNGGRHVIGVLRGFDPFMNLVLDETVEEVSGREKHNIGMVVSVSVI